MVLERSNHYDFRRYTKESHSKSVWADSLRFIDSYGRSEVPEGKSEIWKEAADGIVYGDGYPQEDYFKYERYILRLLSRQKIKREIGGCQ